MSLSSAVSARSTTPVSHATGVGPNTAYAEGRPHTSLIDGARSVLMIGPSPELVGGMATVVGQMSTLSYEGRYQIELFALTHRVGTREGVATSFRRHIQQLHRLRRTLRRLRPAIVHIHTCSGFSFFRACGEMVPARRAGARVILHVHGAAFDAFFERQSRVGRRVIAWGLERADRVVALSEHWREQLLRMAPRARVSVVENAVEGPAESVARAHRGCPVFLMIAAMDLWKGVHDLLDACELLRDRGAEFELVLAGPAGSAGDADSLNIDIAGRGLAGFVRYVGPALGEAKVELLRRADVYVQPSHHEGMPLAVIEAMAFALPVIATSVGALPEMIVDGVHGRLVPPRQPERLAEAMHDLATRVEVRERMGMAGWEAARERFSMTVFERRWGEVYDSLVEGSG